MVAAHEACPPRSGRLCGFEIEGSSLAVGTELFIGEDFNVTALFHAPLDGGPAQLAVFTGAPLWNLTADTSGPYWLEGFASQFELVRYVGGVRQSLVPNLAYGAIALGAAVYVTSTFDGSRFSPVISRLVRSATCAP